MGRSNMTMQRTPPSKKAMRSTYKSRQQTSLSHAHVSREQRDVSRHANSTLLPQSPHHTSGSKRDYERFLRHKHAVQMNNFAMALLDTELNSAEFIIKALKDAIDIMVSVTRDSFEEILPSAKINACTQLFEQMARKESSAPPSPLKYFTLKIPTHHNPVDQSQPQEDAAAILFNMSLVFFLLGAKSGLHKWISKGRRLYGMSRGMARKAKPEVSEETNRRQYEMMSANLREIGHLCIDARVCNLAHQYFKMASAIETSGQVGGSGEVLKQTLVTRSSKAA